MIVEQYGLRYTRVMEEDIELIRYWRNQSFIRETMQFKEFITPEMQKKWFEKINTKYNYYFIIEINSIKVGLINCKDTEPNTRIAEGGIFIWEKDFWGTPIPVFAALTMLECVFEIFKSGDASIATVSRNNEPALKFNTALGYKIMEGNKQGEFLKLILTKQDYFAKTLKLKKAASLYCKGNSEIKITAQENNLLADEIITYLRRQSTSPERS